MPKELNLLSFIQRVLGTCDLPYIYEWVEKGKALIEMVELEESLKIDEIDITHTRKESYTSVDPLSNNNLIKPMVYVIKFIREII